MLLEKCTANCKHDRIGQIGVRPKESCIGSSELNSLIREPLRQFFWSSRFLLSKRSPQEARVSFEQSEFPGFLSERPNHPLRLSGVIAHVHPNAKSSGLDIFLKRSGPKNAVGLSDLFTKTTRDSSSGIEQRGKKDLSGPAPKNGRQSRDAAHGETPWRPFMRQAQYAIHQSRRISGIPGAFFNLLQVKSFQALIRDLQMKPFVPQVNDRPGQRACAGAMATRQDRPGLINSNKSLKQWLFSHVSEDQLVPAYFNSGKEQK